MPTTFVHGLLPAACLLVSRSSLSHLSTAEWRRLLVFALIWGNWPDWDVVPAAIFPAEWTSIHREWGHNVFSLALSAWAGVWILGNWISKELSPRAKWIVSTALLLSHVLFDATNYGHSTHVRSGVPLFWPLSDWHGVLPIRVFASTEATSGGHPLAQMIFSPVYWTKVIFQEFFASLIVFALWSIFWTVSRTLRSAYPAGRLSRKYSPEPPSPHRPGDIPHRTYRGS